MSRGIICITVDTDEHVEAIISEVNDRVMKPLKSCFLTLGWYVFIITFFVETYPHVAITKWADALGFVPHANPIRPAGCGLVHVPVMRR